MINQTVKEMKLTLSNFKNFIVAFGKECKYCHEHEVIHQNHHINKNGFWEPRYICQNCGKEQ